jgi:hypothetical protein
VFLLQKFVCPHPDSAAKPWLNEDNLVGDNCRPNLSAGESFGRIQKKSRRNMLKVLQSVAFGPIQPSAPWPGKPNGRPRPIELSSPRR